MTNTFCAIKLDTIPGTTILRLTRDWHYDAGVLPRGTEVQPFAAGQNNLTNRHERTVICDGEKCTGPY